MNAPEDPFEARHTQAADHLATGRLNEAMIGYQDLVSDTTRVLGPVNSTTVRARLGLGDACRRSGDYDHALVLYESVVRYEEDRLGRAHPEALAIRLAIAETLASAGRTADARDSLTATVRTATRELGADHELTRQVQDRLTGVSSL